ncbi:MAG: tRNA-dihydrouridine synthase family protein [Clostridia bacterium]|nr:tRNA-dihydrouridine synthase family protein [Clostridia bacterium]
MEGVTGYLFRNTFHRFFSGADKYFTPFLSPTQNRVFTRRELQEVLPEHNEGLNVVPQLLTKNAGDFLWAAGELKAMGYREVNLNLGCPSGTVASKGKGSGFLAAPGLLELFLDEVFAHADVLVSVKTRLGKYGPEEFEALLELFNRYPIAELTIHPRVQKDFYKHPVRMEGFEKALPNCRNPVCYNGDLATRADCARFASRFPSVGAVMIGRGLIANPGLLSQARGGPGADRETLRAFADALYGAYRQAFGSDRNAMIRMKEVWFYLIHLFADGGDHAKRLRKTAEPSEYELLVTQIFRELPLLEDAVPAW